VTEIDEEVARMQQEQEPPREGAVCGKCGASFQTQEELDRHVASEHGSGGGEEATRPADR
jgi:uncharacterized C2H2 Zn-finger protein